MAAIALVLGSILGFFGAVIGWAMLDVPLASAVAIYLGTSLCFGGLAVVPSLTAAARTDRTFGHPARG